MDEEQRQSIENRIGVLKASIGMLEDDIRKAQTEIVSRHGGIAELRRLLDVDNRERDS